MSGNRQKWKLREFHFGPNPDPKKLEAARKAWREFYDVHPEAKKARLDLEKATLRNMLAQVPPKDRDEQWFEMWNKG